MASAAAGRSVARSWMVGFSVVIIAMVHLGALRYLGGLL